MEFGHNGGTIGRSLESDWVLPDGQRYLSSRHASIDFRSGSYYIVDTSTNGVYVNDAEQPVGRGNPQRLFTGDRLRIGEYEMSVEITEIEDTRETLADDKHVDPVSKAQRVPPPDPTRADMVAPHEITAVGIEMLIDEDAEIQQIQRHNKANVASLRLEEDVAPAKSKAETPPPPLAAKRPEPAPVAAAPKRPEPPPVSAAARVAPRAPAAPKPHINVAAGAKPSSAPPTAASPRRAVRVARRVLPRRRPAGPAARRQASRAGVAPPRATDARGRARRDRKSASARRAEERHARADDDDSAAEQQPAEVLGERRGSAEQSAVPRVRASICRPSMPCARRSATSSSTSSTSWPRCARPSSTTSAGSIPMSSRARSATAARAPLINADQQAQVLGSVQRLVPGRVGSTSRASSRTSSSRSSRAPTSSRNRAQRLPAALPGRRSSASSACWSRDSSPTATVTLQAVSAACAAGTARP